MRLEFSRFVESDLEAIADFIAEESPRRAAEFIHQAGRAMMRIADQPFLYHLRPEIGAEARLFVVGRYLVLFRIVSEVVRIERIVYGGRDLPQLLEGSAPGQTKP